MTTPIFIRDLLWETGSGVDAAAEIDTRPPSIPSEEAWVQALQIPTGEPPFAPPLDPNAPPTGVVRRILMDLVPQTPGDFTRLVRAPTLDQTPVPPPPVFTPATFRHIPGSWTRDGFYAPKLTTAQGGPIDARLWSMSRTSEVVYLPGGLPAGHGGLIRLDYYRYVGATGGGGGGGGGLVFGDSGEPAGQSILDQSSVQPDTNAVFRKLVGDGIDIELAGSSGQQRLVFANLGVRDITTGTGIGATNNSGTVALVNTGVTSALVSTPGLSVSAATGAVTFQNTGVTSALVSTPGLSVSAATGAVTFQNTGVTSLLVGDGITTSGSTGAVTVTNNGVRSLTSPAVTNPATAQSLIQAGSTAHAVVLRQLVAGAGINLTQGFATTPATSEIITIEATGAATAQWQYVVSGTAPNVDSYLIPGLPAGSGSDRMALIFGTESTAVKDDPRGEGRRLQFTTADGAFRVGEVIDISGPGDKWDFRGLCSVAMGQNNQAGGDYSSVTGGGQNTVDSEYSVVGGGRLNAIGSNYSVICGGGSTTSTDRNEISGNSLLSFIGGGFKNRIQSDSVTTDENGRGACIVGGIENSIGSLTTARITGNFIGGGKKNSITQTSRHNVVAGGQENNIDDASFSAIGGGSFCSVFRSDYCFIGSGGGNDISRRNRINQSSNSFIGSGANNLIESSSVAGTNGDYNCIVGGESNFIGASTLSVNKWNVIGGGTANAIKGLTENVLIGGGRNNEIDACSGAAICGGGYGSISNESPYSFIGGGGGALVADRNGISIATNAVVCGGKSNSLTGLSFFNPITSTIQRAPSNHSLVVGGQTNTVSGSEHCVIGGGSTNTIAAVVGTADPVTGITPVTASPYSTIAGGRNNAINGNSHSVICGGGYGRIDNTSSFSFIGGGGGPDAAYQNVINGNAQFSFIGGGHNNRIRPSTAALDVDGEGNCILGGVSNNIGNSTDLVSATNVISGGNLQTIRGGRGNAVAGGSGNAVTVLTATNTVTAVVTEFRSDYSSILGGINHQIQRGQYCIIAGGGSNAITATKGPEAPITGIYTVFPSEYSSIMGGQHNRIVSSLHSHIAGGGGAVSGDGNIIDSSSTSFIGCGVKNKIDNSSSNCFIGGGELNAITKSGAGGNTNDSMHSVIAGGRRNLIDSSSFCVISGGGDDPNSTLNFNRITRNSAYCTIPGGSNNNITNSNGSFACGRGANIGNVDGCFVWSCGGIYSSTGANQVRFKATGGFVIHTSDDLSTGIQIAGGSSAWGPLCDRNKKDLEGEVDPLRVLAGVESLPLYYWTYKGNNDKSRKNLGPTAQDWQERFPLGRTELMIDTLEFDGVALSAIKGVAQLVRGLEARAEAAEARATEMEARATAAEARATAMEARLAALEARFAPQ